MNNRAKFLISVLFIAAIILTIGLTRFYFDVTKNNAKVSSDEKVVNVLQSYGDMRVFQNANGLCGVIDADGAVLIEPEWLEILDVTPDVVLVSRRMKSSVLVGGVDYEENVVIPFVFRSFQELTPGLYAATVDADGLVLLYDASYQMMLPSAYESAVYQENTLLLRAENGSFSYTFTEGSLKLHRAELQCAIGTEKLNWRVSNQVYLADLAEDDLRRMNRSVSAYISMLIDDDFTDLPEIAQTDSIGGLTRPGTMPDAKFDRVSDFSLTKADPDVYGADAYDFAFTAEYHLTDEAAQTVHIHLFFRRDAENDMILSSANLNFQGTERPAPTDAE